MSQFLETFYEESFEGLEIMESELLNLDVGAADTEVINTIFRAAHSIKGGSGTFGLTAVASFTHVLETLLDEMRDGRRNVTQEAVDLMLESVDVLRDMLSALREDAEVDAARVADTQARLEKLQGTSAAEGGGATPAEAKPVGATSGWRIYFKPNIDMLQTGNDPVRMLRELDALGEMRVEAVLDELPDFPDLEPEDSFLAWNIELQGDIDEASIREIFEWVEDDCELNLEAIATQADTAPEASKPPEGAATNSGRTARKPTSSVEASSIRVSTDKVDELINMVGELVITQSMLSQFGDDEEVFDMARIEKLRDGLAQLERNTRELQESVMRIRMLPISFAFQRFPRLVHDLGGKLGKKIELKLSGEQTELDKTVMEKIGDPLVHLVRNSIDHGLEAPEARVAAGKPETGIVHLNAYHQGGNIVIEISDDGAGLNSEKILAKARERGIVGEDEELSEEQIADLIFAPGFSTADQVSDVSGRGVGMDVVRKNIKALGGSVEVTTEQGVGTTFTIRLPLTLAILDGQSVRVGEEIYILPLVSIIESIQAKPEQIKSVAGRAEVYRLREEYIPIVRLCNVFGVRAEAERLEDGLLVVVEGEGQKVAVFVDDLLGQQQVVIKSLETNFRRVDGVSGATILGDGTVALILDVAGLIKLSQSIPPQRPPQGGRSDVSPQESSLGEQPEKEAASEQDIQVA